MKLLVLCSDQTRRKRERKTMMEEVRKKKKKNLVVHLSYSCCYYYELIPSFDSLLPDLFAALSSGNHVDFVAADDTVVAVDDTVVAVDGNVVVVDDDDTDDGVMGCCSQQRKWVQIQ